MEINNIRYECSNPERKWGRLYETEKGYQSMSPMEFSKSEMEEGRYHFNIDIINCYPEILQELCIKENIDKVKYRYLSHYVLFREEYPNKEEMYKLFFDMKYVDSILNNENYNEYQRKIMKNYYTNIRELIRLFWDNPNYKEERFFAEKEYEEKIANAPFYKNDDYNYTYDEALGTPKNRFIILVLTRIENDIIQLIVEKYKKKVVYIQFDSVMIRISEGSSQTMEEYPELLIVLKKIIEKEVNDLIKNKMRMNIRVYIKTYYKKGCK